MDEQRLSRVDSPELHLVLDIVCLEKRTPQVEIIPLKSIDYKIELETRRPKRKFLNICGFFPMMGGAGNHTSAASVAIYYYDIVAGSRYYKRWDWMESPFFT